MITDIINEIWLYLCLIPAFIGIVIITIKIISTKSSRKINELESIIQSAAEEDYIKKTIDKYWDHEGMEGYETKEEFIRDWKEYHKPNKNS